MARKTIPDPVVELYEHLERLKLSNAEFARHIDMLPNTISRWLKRKTKVPLVVLRYLRTLRRAPPIDPLPAPKVQNAAQRHLRRKSR